ncbi:MAG: AraC family transcriptional regulator [Nocardioidaceae bacterium]
MAASAEIRAWSPPVPGVAEVLHARFTDHVYPLHTHDTWTVLIIDVGAVAYDLDHDEHDALQPLVTVLPPHVPHNGRSATGAGFRKRVLYLEADQLGPELVGRAVDRPALADPALRTGIDRLHRSLREPGDEFEAEARFAVVRERLDEHLRRIGTTADPTSRSLARRLRELLDARTGTGLTLTEASDILGAHPTHLVRSFGREFGMPPHRYLNGRRLDRARRLLLAGWPAGEVAQQAGFFDQSHLTRHFRRLLGVTPAVYSRSGAGNRT